MMLGRITSKKNNGRAGSTKMMNAYIPMNWLKNVIALMLLLGYMGQTHAIELKDFISEALKADPLVLEQVHIHYQAVEDENIALSGWKPSLDFSSVSEDFHDKPTRQSVGSTTENSLTLTQNLFSGFDTTNAVEQTKARITSAVHRVRETADNSALDAIKAYLSILSEQRQLELAKQNVKAHEHILARLQEASSGVIIKLSDIEQTEGRLASAKVSYVAQQNNLQDALTQAYKVIGRNIDPETLSDPTPPPFPEESIEILIKQALMDHPALKSAQQNIEAVKYNYERSKSAWYPQVDLQLKGSEGHNIGGIADADSQSSVILSLQYNFYNGGADIAEQRKRIGAIQENEAFRSRVQRQLIDALRLAWTADRALHEQMPYLRKHSEKSERALEYYREEFLLNKRDLLDVLDAESEFNTAQKKEVETTYDALEARYRVYEGLGRLFESLELAISFDERDIQIADISTKNIYSLKTENTGKKGIYTKEIVQDVDMDTIMLDDDQCDNSVLSVEVSEYGCKSSIQLSLGYISSNNPPTAVADNLATGINEALDIAPEDILGNDTDTDGDKLRIDEFSEPANGSIIIDGEGYLIYSPKKGFTGVDTFTYTATDGYGESSTTTVTIQVGPSKSGTTE